jgi:hypothetical protein
MMLFLLLAGHAIADFCLQNPDMAKGKNRHSTPLNYNPKLHGPLQICWPYYLAAHALCHGLMIFLITKNLWFGLAETFLHFIIDFGKCERFYGIHRDQLLHILCKVGYCIL